MPRCSLFSAKIHNIAGIIEENQQINAIEIGIQVVRRISRKLGRGLKSVPKRIADSERLKNLSTTLSYKVEAKGKDRDEIGFFAKFVLCSNNEHLPVIIDAGETRYWTEKESRMWFNPKRLETDALRKIVRSNRNRLEIEMAELLLDIMASVGVSSVSFCLNDIIPLLVCSQVKVEKSQVRKVVQECWKLAPASNSLSYTTYQYDYNRECRYSPVRRIGRYYTVSREQLETL